MIYTVKQVDEYTLNGLYQLKNMRKHDCKDSKDRVIDLIRIVILFQLGIVGATIFGCFMPGKVCDSDVKQHIANMMTVITTSTFALYAAEK